MSSLVLSPQCGQGTSMLELSIAFLMGGPFAVVEVVATAMYCAWAARLLLTEVAA